MRVTEDFKPDLLDVERLVEMHESFGWAEVAKRGHLSLAKMADELAQSKSWEETLRLQGRMEGTRDALNLPKILIDEARRKVRTK